MNREWGEGADTEGVRVRACLPITRERGLLEECLRDGRREKPRRKNQEAAEKCETATSQRSRSAHLRWGTKRGANSLCVRSTL